MAPSFYNCQHRLKLITNTHSEIIHGSQNNNGCCRDPIAQPEIVSTPQGRGIDSRTCDVERTGKK